MTEPLEIYKEGAPCLCSGFTPYFHSLHLVTFLFPQSSLTEHEGLLSLLYDLHTVDKKL